MKPEEEREEALFAVACELAIDEERSAHLAEVCGADEALRRRVENLLKIEPEAREFFAGRKIKSEDQK